MKYVIIFFIKCYKKFISPLKTPCCRFYPTCSSYAIEALKVHGFFKGSYLSIKRVLRCNPFCDGGFDPVPPKITVRKQKTK
ncbi:MAG: membrane protein insertion efficiency factor YidD [Acutalibacteraceae bacterium]